MYATRARGGAKLNPRFAQIALQPFRNMARQRTARGDGVLKISKRYRHVATFNVRFVPKAVHHGFRSSRRRISRAAMG